MAILCSFLIANCLASTDTQLRLNYGVSFEGLQQVQVVESYILVEVDLLLPQLISTDLPDRDICRTFTKKHWNMKLLVGLCNDYHAELKAIIALRNKANDMIGSTLDAIHSLVTRHAKILDRKARSTDGLLPFVGQLSEILFGTATVRDLHQQKAFLKRLSVGEDTSARQIKILGQTMIAALNITRRDIDLQMRSIEQNTQFLLNMSKSMDINQLRSSMRDQIRGDYLRIELDTIQLQNQLTQLRNEMFALMENKVNPTLLSFEQTRAILNSAATLLKTTNVRGQNLRLPTVSELYGHICLFSEPKLIREEYKLVLNVKIPLISSSDTYYLYKVNKFPLPFHGHYTKLVDTADYIIMSKSNKKFYLPNEGQVSSCTDSTCYMDILLQSDNKDTCLTALWHVDQAAIKSLCDFRLIIGQRTGFVHVVDTHYLFANIDNVTLTCNGSTTTQSGCTSCLKSFPCGCSVVADRWTFKTPLSCLYTSAHPVTLYPFNLASLQHLNGTFTSILDPTALYSTPLTMYPLTQDLKIRQEKILAKEQSNNIKLWKYMNALSAHQDEFNRMYESPSLIDTQAQEFNIFWANRIITFVVTPVMFVALVSLCARVRRQNLKDSQPSFVL